MSADCGEALFHLENVTKDYRGRRVLTVDELDIRRGEVLALVGPSGAGKSTLLRLLNFLEAPTRGRVLFHQAAFEPGGQMPLDLRRRVTMVFQRPMLLNRSVYANVRFGLDLRGEHHANGRITTALEEVGLASSGPRESHHALGRRGPARGPGARHGAAP